MPFVKDGEALGPIGEIGSGLPPATLVVEPDKVLALKRGLEDQRTEIEDFLRDNRWILSSVPPPGADPCSAGVAEALSRNGQAAVAAALGYTQELTNLINSLEAAAKIYGLTDEANAATFGREPA